MLKLTLDIQIWRNTTFPIIKQCQIVLSLSR